jgi:hypothetical protein
VGRVNPDSEFNPVSVLSEQGTRQFVDRSFILLPTQNGGHSVGPCWMNGYGDWLYFAGELLAFVGNAEGALT